MFTMSSMSDTNEGIDAVSSSIKKAIKEADPYQGRGTTYLHGRTLAKDEHNNNPSGAVVVPISLATTFKQSTPGQPTAIDDPNSFGMGYEYSRTGNPTRGSFERAMAAAENSKHCIAFSSGSAATSAVVHLLSRDGSIVCIDDVYGGTQRYFRKIVAPTMGISIDFIDFGSGRDGGCDLSLLEEKIVMKQKQRQKKYVENGDCDKEGATEARGMLLWLETPTNPTLKVTDIRAVAEKTHQHGCLLAVDNTFCSPYFQSPLELGADIVVHSVTKYINGHSDVVMGVVCVNDDKLYKDLKFIQNGVGAVPSPFDCFLAHRGLKTLHIRMEAAARNAMAIALFLEQHEGVVKVIYPGLRSHPQHEVAKKQQRGFGAMITFYCKGKRTQSALILQHFKVFQLAESLGAIESLAESPSLMTHASVPDEQRAILGIDDTLIRLSVGIESCQDLIDDLDQALNVSLSSL